MKKPRKSLGWLMAMSLLAGGMLASTLASRARADVGVAPLMTLDS